MPSEVVMSFPRKRYSKSLSEKYFGNYASTAMPNARPNIQRSSHKCAKPSQSYAKSWGGTSCSKLDSILQRCTISCVLIRPWFGYICPQLCTCDLCDGFPSHLRVDVDPES